MHAIGPITRTEVRRLELLAPDSIAHNPHIGGPVVAPRDGACTHLGDDGCRVHAAHGALAKPSVCRRFPYRLVATPTGRRVSTEHRCPCRTMGDRPPIDLDDARASLRDGAGRLAADVVVGRTVRLDARRRVPFARWERIERVLLERLSAGEHALAVLDAEPFPRLEEVSWVDVAHHYRSKLDGSSCGQALAWFGDALLSLHDAPVRGLRERPWAPAFDRAEARTATIERPEAILADWLADELWGLEWVERGTFAHARLDLATRWAVADHVARRLAAAGVRPDRAAAEAVLVGEMAGAAPLWRSVVRAFVL